MTRAAVCLLIALIPRASTAQSPNPPPLTAGTLIRFQSIHEGAVTGLLVHPLQRGDSTIAYCLYPRPECAGAKSADLRTVQLADVQRLEVSQGSETWKGALIGGVAAASLLAIASVAWSGYSETEVRLDARRVAGLVSFVGIGSVIGGWIGSRHRRWATVNLGPD